MQRQTLAATTTQRFLPSGSSLLDLVLGGGWAYGRVVNLVGDKSSGKTLLAIEACANFCLQGNDPARARYVEAEEALDVSHARRMGLPRSINITSGVETVEALHNDLLAFLDDLEGDSPSLYIIDSLDALSDEAEMEREIGAGSYGAAKAKKLSEMFRRLISPLAQKNCTLFVISQIRDKLGVTFGETKTRSGGRALDFYASQVIWLAELEKIKRTVQKIQYVVGVKVLAKSKKNKVAIPFREAKFPIIFNYGVDDEASMLDWLKTISVSSDITMDRLAQLRLDNNRPELKLAGDTLREQVAACWQEIEDQLARPYSKYEE